MYQPSVRQPKWFVSDRDIRVGDVVLFTKSDKEFEKIYQYGIVLATFEGKDGLTRVVEVQYQNSNETVKRTTKRCVRELVIVHPVVMKLESRQNWTILPKMLSRSYLLVSMVLSNLLCNMSSSLPFYCHSDFNLNMLPNHIFLQGTCSTSLGADHTKTENGSCMW